MIGIPILESALFLCIMENRSDIRKIKVSSMTSNKDLFWIKMLWSAVVIFTVTLFAYIRYDQSPGIIGFGIYPYVFSPYVIGTTIIVLMMGLVRLIRKDSFYHVLAGTSNAYLTIVGLYVILTAQVKTLRSIDLLFVANGLFAAVILIKAYRG